MKSSIATVCLSGTLETKLDAAAAAGFDQVEIFENDFVTSALSAADVGDRCADLGLRISLYQPFRDFEGVGEEQFELNLRRAEAKLEVASAMGADGLLVCSNVATATIDDDRVMAEQLRQLGDLGSSAGVRIAYEALGWGRFVSTYERSWDVVRGADHENVGLCLDSFHILSVGSTLQRMLDIPGEKVFICQLADAPRLALDPLSWSRHHRVFPGEGSYDLSEFVANLVEIGYAGPLSLEVFNDTFRQTDPYRTAVDGLRSLRQLEDSAVSYQRSLGATNLGELRPLPPASPADTIDFVEVRSTGNDELASVLGALGFTRVGEHRRKAVTLWSQASARLIVNSAEPLPDSVGVSALGFIVANSADASARAEELLAPVVARDSVEGEQALTVVLAPDQTEIYFSAPEESLNWQSEFEAASSPTGTRSTGITGIDHVAIAAPWQHYDEAVLFYRSILGLRPNERVDILDPAGLVRSQVMSNDESHIRLALNVLPSAQEIDEPREQTNNVNHVAFASDDLFATVSRLAERGVPMLDIPDNYYDDLRARFDLADEFVGRLQVHRVLFDRDESGAFLQVYTRAIGNIFFEVVQRIDGYQGYGAPNASTRRAAQARVGENQTVRTAG